MLNKDGAKNVVVELTSVKQKSGSVIFKVVVLEGVADIGGFTESSLFIDWIAAGHNQVPGSL